MLKKLAAFIIIVSLAVAVAGCGKSAPTSPVVAQAGEQTASAAPTDASDFSKNIMAAAASNTLPAQTYTYKLSQWPVVPLSVWYINNNQWKQEIVTTNTWQKQVTLNYGFYFSAQPSAAGNSNNSKSLSLYKGSSHCSSASGTGSDLTLQGLLQ